MTNILLCKCMCFHLSKLPPTQLPWNGVYLFHKYRRSYFPWSVSRGKNARNIPGICEMCSRFDWRKLLSERNKSIDGKNGLIAVRLFTSAVVTTAELLGTPIWIWPANYCCILLKFFQFIRPTEVRVLYTAENARRQVSGRFICLEKLLKFLVREANNKA